MKNNEESKNKSESKIYPSKNKQELDFGGWFTRVEGTVAEPWPTAEELLADKDVQAEIRKVERAFAISKNKNHK